jgi:hypothetical protein
MTNVTQVANWLSITEQLPTKPTFVKDEVVKLNFRLLLEEFIELAQSTPNGVQLLKEVIGEIEWNKVMQKEPSFEGCMDAWCDIEVVKHNLVCRMGMSQYYQRNYDIVMNSNNTKFCNTMEQAKLSIAKYKEDGVKAYAEDNKNGKFIIRRDSDDKILKGVLYKEPQILLQSY